MGTLTHIKSRSGASLLPLGALIILALPSLLVGQTTGSNKAETSKADTVYRIRPITVTVTRGPREVFRTPKPVIVLDRAMIQEQNPNTITDLFRNLPGVDVSGVGVNQTRPSIRGQRGARILLLQDGIRMNNSRRQQDFGELPALVDVGSVERVEIVRGPSSVLYGTDAIGGVVNVVTRRTEAEGLHGSLSYKYGAAEDQNRWSARTFGASGKFSYNAGLTVRRAGAYEAPAGTFGNITLATDTPVNNTGLEDRNWDIRLGLEASEGHLITLAYEGYDAEKAGFGDVSPSAFADGLPSIEILYPDQRFDKVVLGYEGSELGWSFADRVDIRGYGQDNDRVLTFGLDQAIGPGATLAVDTRNVTDITTFGFRAEARKLLTEGLLLTYGVDFSHDDAVGTDQSTTVILGFGPPMVFEDDRPQVPNSTFQSLGFFVQGELDVTDRFAVVVGGRFQDIDAKTNETPGLDDELVSKSDETFVGAVNAIFEVSEQVSVIASVGRAFRSPNLIEWFFNGATPEGSGFQVRNPDLEAETSFNVDLGMRFRNRFLEAEVFGFRNKIFNGIRIEALGTDVGGFPAFQNVNVDELIYKGVEVGATGFLGNGFSIGGGYTYLDSENALDPNSPVGESFSQKLTSNIRYQAPGNRFWVQYDIRHNGDQKEVDLLDNPIGDLLPSFTVQNVRAGFNLFQSRTGATHRIGITVSNLTNELYAEASNASFFRPEPKRNVTVSYEISF